MDPNSKDPACLKMGHHRRGNGPQGGQTNGPSGNGPSMNNNNNNMNNGPMDHKGPPGNWNGPDHKGPPGNWNGPDHKGPPGNWNGPDHKGPPGNWNGPHGHPPFHTWMRGFNFPFFARPFFDVRPGIIVPRSYRLRPVPPEILWYYPQYAGYLYFIGRHDEIVIVSPRSLRIITILD